MDSYTLGSGLMVAAMESKQNESGEKYPMELNGTDFSTLIRALAVASGATDILLDGDEADAALSLLSSIGENLGIEGI